MGGIHRWPVNSPHKGPVTRKMFPFDDVIMWCLLLGCHGECVSSLAPGRCGSNFKSTFFKLILQNNQLGSGWELNLRRLPQTLTDEKSTLVPVMHYLSQFWPRSLSPYGITRPQWINPKGYGIYPNFCHFACYLANNRSYKSYKTTQSQGDSG